MERRQFLKVSVGAGFGALAQRWSWAQQKPGAKAGSKGKNAACILLWLEGGPSQLELFDPKPKHRNGGPTKAIKTRTEGLLFASSLGSLAERSNELCVIRSLSSTEGDHRRASYFVKTGHKPIAGISRPAFGAVASHGADTILKGSSILPPYMKIGGRLQALDPGQGFLAADYAPFLIGEAGQAIADLQPPKSLSLKRQQRRHKLLAELDKDFQSRADEAMVEARQKAMKKAAGLRGRPELKAFNLALESRETRQSYGENGFGRGCLLARRLIEQGVRCVEVRLGGWDTHDNNFERCAALGRVLDQGFSALIDDLKAKKLLDSTLIVCMGEFGRTPRINNRQGRDHYPRAFGAMLAGRGVSKGKVVGQTSKDGLSVVKDKILVPDLFATLGQIMGLSPKTEFLAGERPMTLSDGRVQKQLLA